MEEMMRIACVAVPELELQALVRADPELSGRPLAVIDGRAGRRAPEVTELVMAAAGGAAPVAMAIASAGGTRGGGGVAVAASVGGRAAAPVARAAAPALVARVRSVSEAAYAAGVRPGLTVAQARAIWPALEVRSADAVQIAAARAALGDVGLSFAPKVEVEGAEAFLEVGDLGRLFHGEREIALGLAARARAVGFSARVGIAASKGLARLAAWAGDAEDGRPRGESLRVVAPGQEAAFVAELPVALLRPSPAIREALERWGIRRSRELGALPIKEVALRLGSEGERLHRLARGQSDEPLRAQPPEATIEEGVTLDFAIYELESLAFVLRGLLDRLLERLQGRSLACAALTLRLQIEHRGHDVREVPLAAPTRETATLLELVRLHVARRPPEAGIVGVTLVAHPARVRGSQLDLFCPAGPAPDRLAQTVARLEALVGEGAVGAPRPVDTYRDEAIAIAPYRPPAPAPLPPVWMEAARGRDREGVAATDVAGRPLARGPEEGCLALRRFRPALEVEVLMDGGRVPRALSGSELSAQVVVAAGPYRVRGEWWAAGGFARDYWDVHASDGTLYRMFCDPAGRWFVEGYYD
jgi:protein ImuB